jgi:glycosyltransferase involved in cell wall biosynthesis
LKILHLIQKPQLRGAEIFTSQLSTHLQNQGHEVILVSIFSGQAKLPFNGKIIALNGSQNKKYWDLKAWKDLASLIKNEKPDIVQANAGDTLKYAVFSKLLFSWKQPIVFRNASTISLYIKSAIVKRLYNFLFSHTSKIISVSNASATDFGNLFPACKTKIVTIPIGIEKDERIEKRMFQNPYNHIASNLYKLIHVGGFTFEKNHIGLLSIFEIITKQIPNATLHLIGDGPLREEIENTVQEKQLSHKVFFHGYQQDPLQWIQYADTLLLPSHIEGLPGVILEAFYCKTPVVAYDTGGIHEIVKQGETGYIIQKENENAFANMVIQAISKSNDQIEMTQNAFALVTKQYMNAKIAKRFLNIYKETIH